MKSQQVKRVFSGALAASAVIAVVNVGQSPANATPHPAPQTPPSGSSDELEKYRNLASQAEKVNEDLLKAKDDLAAKQSELDRANGDLESAHEAGARASADKERFRGDVDKFADASFTGGDQLNKMSALLTGNSAQDFLDRSSAIGVLAESKNRAMGRLSSAVNQAKAAETQASDAQGRAQGAKDTAATLTSDIESRQQSLQDQMKQIEQASGLLSDSDKAAQGDTGGSAPSVKAPGPAAQKAVDSALSKLGSSYSWGATGPSTFDCSGLITWAYEQAGISLPRSSRAQSTSGQSVSKSDLQPGDLVFFYQPISHVGIYVGGGQMIAAPSSGDVVKYADINSSYYRANYSGAVRPG